ncbi:hypothetical protein [Microbacterium sp. K41]|uniref:hypothetical protein n=1 Tax=Microbacterium sp. K41 TaxID=2305437 RepID=UPI00109C183F|nr:hypothetical protein [Microbacterium sp. K41]
MIVLVAALVLGVLGAVFTALAGVSAFRGRTREVQEGLYSTPKGDTGTFAFTLAAGGCTALAVVLSTISTLASVSTS